MYKSTVGVSRVADSTVGPSQHHHHSLLVQLTYRSRTQSSFKNLTAYAMSTSEFSNSLYTALV